MQNMCMAFELGLKIQKRISTRNFIKIRQYLKESMHGNQQPIRIKNFTKYAKLMHRVQSWPKLVLEIQQYLKELFHENQQPIRIKDLINMQNMGMAFELGLRIQKRSRTKNFIKTRQHSTIFE